MTVNLVILVWWGWVPEDVSSPNCRFSPNGPWVSVGWTSQPVDDGAIQRLVEDASRRGIRYLLPFVAYLRGDGTFNSSYDRAEEFVAAFRQFNRQSHVLVWMGVTLVNDGPLGVRATVALLDPSGRKRIASFAGELVEGAGFDGVYLDVESICSGDENYLMLLEEVAAVIGDRTLSGAGSYWLPRAVSGLPVLERFKWDGDYYRAVTERADQIVAMAYDSRMRIPALYRLWLREQASGIERNLVASDVELLVGIPLSREETLTHHPTAENARNGLAGVCAGAPVPR